MISAIFTPLLPIIKLNIYDFAEATTMANNFDTLMAVELYRKKKGENKKYQSRDCYKIWVRRGTN
jgi:hypothetical protein